MNIVYFYSEVMGYTLSVIKELVSNYGATVHVVYWDNKNKTNFVLPILDNVVYYKRSEMDIVQLKQLLVTLNPKILYVSGRMDKTYLKATLFARKRKIITISGFDAQWLGTFKNKIVSLFAVFLYKRYFDYIWVPGYLQANFAMRLGYKKEHILLNLLSADTTKFEKYSKRSQIAKQIVFVGRLDQVKGIDILVNAFSAIKSITRGDWKLIIIGNGPLEKTGLSKKNIEMKGFLQPEELINYTQAGGVFALPSRKEPWGVVLHEFAAAGFPIICSDACGARSLFVKHGYNGFVFKNECESELQLYIENIMNMNDEELSEFAKRSVELSKVISPAKAAKSLMAVLNNSY